MPNISNEAFSLDGVELPSDFPYRAYVMEPHWERLVGLGDEVVLERGEQLHAERDARFCYLVLDGMVGSSNPAPAGSPQHGAFFLRGSLFLESNALSGLPSDTVFTALERTTLMRIGRERMKAAMMADGDVFDLVICSLAHKFFSANERLRETERYDVRMRVYLMLLGFAKDCDEPLGDDWYRITFKLTQQMIGDMLGANRVTVNTAVRNLADEGVVDKRDGSYLVRDPKGLIV
ncbi:Crp/Fnr family transcriptional regulator [Gordonibacter massiliensis (ex Traore et al. 2017)]|uniref:Crp/Fnr family transcriptional regulator n=1 Tax=Gordonibacter massiliensis (ex Traore et al. 2017) TaxID=1841863 RepID=A0A842JGW3_9ACTN|nr:Crp/Fnr family transcriptional regulator [Gordonibacter massiliensis (ex Traore et al. 2017)]MBC2888509.1 Crp/Fnr family transcriptional regulator [Gordonibacter massiliensis (ex Traore et al. 2017)]